MSPKSILLSALAVGSFASGVVDQYFYPGMPFPPTALVFAVICIIVILTWYRLDSTQIGYHLGSILVLLPWALSYSRTISSAHVASSEVSLPLAQCCLRTLRQVRYRQRGRMRRIKDCKANNSFKPSPLRGLVQVLIIFTCPRPQSGPA